MIRMIGYQEISSLMQTSFIMLSLLVLLQEVIIINEYHLRYIYGLNVRTWPDFNFAAVGDWGCTPISRNTVNNIVSKDPELVLGLGDYSYEDKANCWLQLINPIDHKMKIVIGNHDNRKYATNVTSYPSPLLLQQYMDHFNLSKQFYSFNYENVHFIAMSTEAPYDYNSEQYKFVKNDLAETVTNANIHWIVAFYHRLAYSSPSLLDSLPDFRDIFHPLFAKYNVDLVMQGHSHNYQRSFPIEFNNSSTSKPIITDYNVTNYLNPRGQIFTITGTGGAYDYHKFTEPAAKYIATQFNAYGYLNIDIINNGTKLIGTFYNNNGSINDKFTIFKSQQ
jgi:predicted phosphodiesterase